ncbi:MAG TPA: hypothetical protein VGS19_19660 [Streptosporangiaceae bacterium]|nr:hypothetical protein [Streptosporangiaceae bacterium]
MPTRAFMRLPRRALTCLLAPALAIGTIAATTPPAHHTPAAQMHGRAHPGTRPPRSPLARAQAQASATHHPVLVTSMTTPDSVTAANPNSTLTQTETLQPTRTLRHSMWVPLNPALRRGPGRRVTPVATAAPLTLSDGGTGPLAVLDENGYTLTVTWPTPLPAPTLDGDTATYPDVLPGVDLLVTDDGQGDVTTTLVISNATAAANPALASLQVSESAPGLTLSEDSWGSLTWAA